MKKIIKFKKLPIYHINLCLIVDDDTKVLEDTFTRESLNNVNIIGDVIYAHTLWLDKEGDLTLVILLNFNNSVPITLGTIIHEINHIKNMIFLYLGMSVDLENDESESYIMEHITDWVIYELEKYGYLDVNIQHYINNNKD